MKLTARIATRRGGKRDPTILIRSRSRGGDCARDSGVVALDGGISETCVNIGRLQTAEVLNDFRFRHAGGEHFEHVLHADARVPATLARFRW